MDAAWGKVAASAKTELLGGQALTTDAIFGGAGLSVGLHASGQVACAEPGYPPDGATGSFDGAGLAGTEAEVTAWWNALKPLVPAP